MKQEKKKGGRPAFYKTPEELQAAVDEYFKSCEGVPVFDKNGVPVTKRNGAQRMAGEKPPTLSGLSLYLGFKDRRMFTRQKYRGAEFNDIVLTAKLRCEDFWERALMDEGTYNGARFVLLTAFGWKQEYEQNTATQPPQMVKVINRPRKDGDTGGGDPGAMGAAPGHLLN